MTQELAGLHVIRMSKLTEGLASQFLFEKAQHLLQRAGLVFFRKYSPTLINPTPNGAFSKGHPQFGFAFPKILLQLSCAPWMSSRRAQQCR